MNFRAQCELVDESTEQELGYAHSHLKVAGGHAVCTARASASKVADARAEHAPFLYLADGDAAILLGFPPSPPSPPLPSPFLCSAIPPHPPFYIVRLFGWARKMVIDVGLRMGEPGREEERSARKSRRSVDGSVEWMGAWTGAAARERHYLLDETLPAHSGAPLSPSLVRWRLFPLHRAITTLASSVNFLDGVMRYANGRCMLDYIPRPRRVYLAARASDSNTDPLVTAYLPGIGRYVLTSLYAALLPPLLPSAAFYQLGLQNTFMATDPRDSVGVVKDPFDGVFSARLSSGPPLPIQNLTHIATASVASLAFVTPVVGCTYPDTWSAIGSPVPEVCTETPSR
ncbi:hypothetical protein B0H13DRAFT_2349129 [Mycena leptocephala]|nr:hypothetical protein B0H13DRAFT_2349129 [Mycena leptocephala]